MDATATKKLFHAIVVIGMATAAACSNGSNPPVDASTGNDANNNSNDSGGTKDVAVADTGGGTDASSDGFTGWLGC